MAKIILNNTITNLTASNTYVVDSVIDYSGAIITSAGNNKIVIEDGGELNNATINSTTNPTEIKINSTDICVTGVIYSGSFIQGSAITCKKTTSIQSYTLPIGFEINTLYFNDSGDRGGATFIMYHYSKISHADHFYPFNPVGTNNTWIYKPAELYYAETLGMFSTSEGDKSKMTANSAALQRYGGRTQIIQFNAGIYYIRDINVDEFKDWQGNAIYIRIRLRGVSPDVNDWKNRTWICTDWSNFMYCINHYSFCADIENLCLSTAVGNLFDPVRSHARQGYGFTKFKSDGVTVSDNMELSLISKNCLIYGFYGGFYSGQHATACRIEKTKFLGCRYGFYANSECNLSWFFDVQFHQCAFAMTGGGYQCSMKNIEYTPENWYRDSEAVADTRHYFYKSRGIGQSMIFENVYSEGYMGDSAAKFIHYEIELGAIILFKGCALPYSNYIGTHLKITKSPSYPHASSTGMINYTENSSLPTIVSTDNNLLIRVFADGKPFYADDGIGNKFLCQALGYQVWEGNFVLNTNIHGYTQFKPVLSTDMKYYAGLMSAYDRGGQTLNLNEFFYTSNCEFIVGQKNVRIKMILNGTAKTTKPFAINIGQKKFIIKPIYNGTTCTFDETFLYEGASDKICNLSNTLLRIDLSSNLADNGDLLFIGTATQGGGDGIVDFGTYILEIEGLA